MQLASINHTPDPVDVHVGSKMRMQRKRLGHTQTALADALGITFQQVQKYERGANRVSASMLYRAARFLAVEPGWFFEGLDHSGPDQPTPDPLVQFGAATGGLELAELYAQLGHKERGVVISVAEALSDRQPTPSVVAA